MRKYLRFYLVFFLIAYIFLISVTGCQGSTESMKNNDSEMPVQTEIEQESKETYKILHVMSYHTPWEWTETQLQGFKDAMENENIEYKVFEMDTKNFSTDEQKQKKAQEAMELIDSWEPDLLFTGDEDAQEYVARHYVGTSLPIVFSAVNREPKEYGFDGAENVTGVLEHEHFIQNINLLKEIVPDVQDIAVIFDDDPIWQPTEQRMKESISEVESVTLHSWDYIGSFDVYKSRIKELQTEVDAIALIGIFTFKDENGVNVHYRDVLKWTAENSNLPDFSFWKDRVTFGTLSAVSVSGYEQGHAAGLLARQILVEGKSPGSLPILPSMTGEPLINKARADDLGLKIKSKSLLSSEVITEYGWMVSNE
ncbi:ABC transporter substrate-binding protein [Aquibacillus rhizosphaerae]|uniref:ABC transporter substrate binding protein n=1 Tax=Aquibacillus rhizosphaerae TaxID=3051431 RepID=A0ABT7L406_9BACI|nr:ABC transporter substrate binding protein [Aquibacillus sp. LR5S19]MDL4840600.1 ABC transporter substrate binding protein [Aquibacillus sp. LR5S19]